MSNKLEKLIQQNREMLDTLEPRPELWDKIQGQLPGGGPPGGPDGSNPGGGSGVSAGAKAGAFVKWAAAVVTAGVVGTALFFAFNGGNNNLQHDTVLEPGTELAANDDLTTEAKPLLVNPPVPDIDVPFMTFTLPAESGKTIHLDNGTIIDVPAHTFVDKMGKPISGPVDLKYREFHDAADLMLSGITMKFDTGDSIADFQTAGMNEIHGFQNGEEIYFAEGKSIGITLASFTPEDDYGLYYLDQETGKGWQDIGKAEIIQNQEKAKVLAELPELPPTPEKPVKKGETEYVLGFTVDYEEFPEIKEYKNVQWEYQDVEQLESNQWIFGEAWSDATLKLDPSQAGLYTLELKNKRKNFSTSVRPILEGKDYEKELKKFNKKLETYTLVKNERLEKEKWMAMQADLGRHFQVERWGTYNCDRFLRIPGRVAPKTTIELVGAGSEKINVKNLTVYHMCGSMRACFKYEVKELDRLRFSTEEANALVVVLPGKRFAAFSPDDFKSIDKSLLKKQDRITFSLHPMAASIKSPEELRIALGI